MPLDLDNCSVEFGVCIDQRDRDALYHVPISEDVKHIALEMLRASIDNFGGIDADLPIYDPAEKSGEREAYSLPLGSPFAERFRTLLGAQNLDTNSAILDGRDAVLYYFFDFRDIQGNRLVGLHRSTQFKGLLRSRLVSVIDDSLVRETRRVFRLDPDFDVMIADGRLLIQRVASFEFMADLVAKVLETAREAFQELKGTLPFVDMSGMDTFVARSNKAARLAAAIKSRTDLADLTPQRLERACLAHGIQIAKREGTLVPDEETAMDFLNLLDRRLYNDPLVDEDPTCYVAPSRAAKKPKPRR